MNDLYGLITLDLACLLAAAAMLRAWRRRRSIDYRLVVGPTLVIALLVLLQTARYERRLEASGRPPPPAR
ncbi:MAG: hypothetical protein E6J08_13010 [Chloroflexi bacterium]|nr:MAG: hypothetical protein E6J08_13010 [Chloroflexota bacterium]